MGQAAGAPSPAAAHFCSIFVLDVDWSLPILGVVNSERRHRIFFALQLDAAAAARAQDLAVRLGRASRASGLTPLERLHVSLNFVGVCSALSRDLVDRACATAGGVAAPSFVVALNRASVWKGGGQCPLVLWGDEGAFGVERLHSAIHTGMVGIGLARGAERPFWPHLTIGWGAEPPLDVAVDPVSWRVGSFVLLDSIVGEGRHEVLGRWPLAPPQASSSSRAASRAAWSSAISGSMTSSSASPSMTFGRL
jgi:2'-5' RNA ligase